MSHRNVAQLYPRGAITGATRLDTLRAVITPWLNLDYKTQLVKKQEFARNTLRLVAQKLKEEQSPIRVDVNRLPCSVEGIIPAPTTHGYRNKDEFSTGHDYDGKKTVGFFCNSWKGQQSPTCLTPEGLEIMKESHVKITNLLNKYVREVTPLGLALSLGTDGGWRRFMVRSNKADELMTIGVINPRTLTVKQIHDEKLRFKDYMITETDKSNLKLDSLYVQPCHLSRCPHSLVPFELLHGQEFLQEEFNGLKMRVSPESDYPPHTLAAERMFKLINAKINNLFPKKGEKKRLIIELSCGSGILTLQLSRIVDFVIGIDGRGSIIEDAKKSAAMNSIENVEFISAQAEIVLERVLEKYDKYAQEIIIVCDIRTAALHPATLEAIRNCKRLRQMVYITSRPTGRAMENLLDLCHRNTVNRSMPFEPILATPIDMLPHTEHQTLIILFERDIK